MLERVEGQLRLILDPVRAQMDYAAERIATGETDFDDASEFEAFVRGMFAGTSQVRGIGYLRPARPPHS